MLVSPQGSRRGRRDPCGRSARSGHGATLRDLSAGAPTSAARIRRLRTARSRARTRALTRSALVAAAVAAAILVLGLVYAGSPAKIAEGVHVAGADVGGLTVAQAEAALERRREAARGHADHVRRRCDRVEADPVATRRRGRLGRGGRGGAAPGRGVRACPRPAAPAAAVLRGRRRAAGAGLRACAPVRRGPDRSDRRPSGAQCARRPRGAPPGRRIRRGGTTARPRCRRGGRGAGARGLLQGAGRPPCARRGAGRDGARACALGGEGPCRAVRAGPPHARRDPLAPAALANRAAAPPAGRRADGSRDRRPRGERGGSGRSPGASTGRRATPGSP